MVSQDRLDNNISISKDALQKLSLNELFEDSSVNGKDLVGSEVIFDPQTNQPVIQLRFSNEGREKFSEVVKTNIENHYSDMGDKVKVMIIPDICSIEFGRGVGYNIIERIPPQEIHDISATKIREELRAQGKL
jgi:preprotein translocase subunit SecD